MQPIKRPALRYYGAKFSSAPKILKFTPPHSIFVDPFGGGGGIFWRKPRVGLEVYNDLSGEVVNFFKHLRDNTDALLRSVYLTPFSREELLNATSTPVSVDVDALEAARQFFIRSWMSIQGEGVPNTSSNFRGSRTSGGFFPPDISELYKCAERFKNVVIENIDAFKIIDKYDSDNTWFYIDPPYNGSPGEDYSCGFTSHTELAEVLHNCGAYISVSSLDDKLYRELYWDWAYEEISVNGTANTSKKELLWMNYTL